MKKTQLLLITCCFLATSSVFAGSVQKKSAISKSITLSKEKLADKIKGGWAGQTNGCTYGGPVEFIYNGTLIQDYIAIELPDGAIKN